MSNPFGGKPLLLDKSAWQCQQRDQVRVPWRAALEQDQLLMCAVTAYELLFSARNSSSYFAIERRLAGFRDLPLTASVHRAALAGMRSLAERGQHRVPLPDLLVAAAAQDAGVGVLHYDRHFDRLADVMTFDSVWVAPAGSLDPTAVGLDPD